MQNVIQVDARKVKLYQCQISFCIFWIECFFKQLTPK